MMMGRLLLLAALFAATHAQSCYEQAPFDCTDGTYCTRWYDGCNQCACDSPDGFVLCTERYCGCLSDQSCIPSCNDNDQCSATGMLMTVEEEEFLEPVIRFSFRFGFFQDELTPDATEIIQEDIEGVICQTQYFMSWLVQNATNAKSIHVRATEIDWGFYDEELLPAHINFTVEFTDAITGTAGWLDDQVLINEMEKLGDQGLQWFITDWVWRAEPNGLNFFVNANRMAFDGAKQAPVEGTLDQAECPETMAPTVAPSIYTEALTWPFGPNYSDLDDLDPMVDFSLLFSLFDQQERRPTQEEVNALICQVNSYYTTELQRKLNDTIHAKAVYIDYYLDEAREAISLNFTTFAFYDDEAQTQVNATDVFEAMQLTSDELEDFVELYVWRSEPEQENVFFNTEALSIQSSIGDAINDQAMIVEATGCIAELTTNDTLAGNTNTTNNDTLRFMFEFGFLDETPQELVREDVEYLMCQTQVFLTRVLSDLLEDDVSVVTTDIEYGYVEGHDLPAQVNFSIVYQDEDGMDVADSSVYDQILVNTLENLTSIDWEKFLNQYVREPTGLNLFGNANQVVFQVDRSLATTTPVVNAGEMIIGTIPCPDTSVAASRLHHHVRRGDDIEEAFP
ncbi:expressed unknown protein [Seminavis robusta]|uniref:Uncharacterized protein n=1 Tax=Seminavis robusta TaxID=568900 RepID=A0A9N8EQJ3_9STRA|nr:expressed unknown protein [Seminavis robusta]|eukprot:Sro1350_g265160.1 n/a (623) ;mRNA; f:28009-29877